MGYETIAYMLAYKISVSSREQCRLLQLVCYNSRPCNEDEVLKDLSVDIKVVYSSNIQLSQPVHSFIKNCKKTISLMLHRLL